MFLPREFATVRLAFIRSTSCPSLLFTRLVRFSMSRVPVFWQRKLDTAVKKTTSNTRSSRPFRPFVRCRSSVPADRVTHSRIPPVTTISRATVVIIIIGIPPGRLFLPSCTCDSPSYSKLFQFVVIYTPTYHNPSILYIRSRSA